jgi:hypothetical protein
MRKFLLLLTFLIATTSTWAQRALPPEAKRAEIGAQQALPMVAIGNQLLRLAPGGVILDKSNRSITHGQLPPGSDVVYQTDRNGEVLRIVILTPEEQARLDRAK